MNSFKRFCSALVLVAAVAGLSACGLATKIEVRKSQEYSALLVAEQYATKAELKAATDAAATKLEVTAFAGATEAALKARG